MTDPVQRAFPGATSVSRLHVYDWPASDGLSGGSPHLHTATTEGYVVTGGEGRVQTISSAGFQEHELRAGAVLWFSPGTVHRLINEGGLDILVVMGNAGLPEAGDAVFTFPPHVLADEDAYQAAATKPNTEPLVTREAAVRARRDLAMDGFTVLRARTEQEGPAPLHELHSAAAAIVRSRAAGEWKDVVSRGVAAEAERTSDGLQRLAEGDGSPLHAAGVWSAGQATAPEPMYGMCGFLQKWDIG